MFTNNMEKIDSFTTDFFLIENIGCDAYYSITNLYEDNKEKMRGMGVVAVDGFDKGATTGTAIIHLLARQSELGYVSDEIEKFVKDNIGKYRVYRIL